MKAHAQGHSIRRGHNEGTRLSRRSRMQALASSVSQCLLLFLLYLCLVLHKKKKNGAGGGEDSERHLGSNSVYS